MSAAVAAPALFVYGTLRRGAGAPARKALEGGARPLGLARMPGRLWHLGAYPGMTEPEGEGEWVVGELYELERPRAVLERLDAYEGSVREPTGPAGFTRVRRDALREDGGTRRAWVYLWRGPTSGALPVADGDWMGDRGPRLLLVRHSTPVVDPSVPASRWRLSSEGRERAARLAGPLAAHRPAVVVTSREPKARETGAILADALEVPLRRAPGLEEHRRETIPFLPSEEAFVAGVRALFDRPRDRVFGEESAAEALRRFADGLHRVLRAHPLATVAVVTHGTVLSLFAAQAAGLDPAALWRRLELPCFLVLRRPDFRLEGDVVRATRCNSPYGEPPGATAR